MQTDTFSDIFPLFDAADSETLEWLLSVAVERDYPPGRAVLMEDAWGNAVYFIVSGWVKVRHIRGQDAITLAVLSQGDFFGEMAILDESPRSTDVVAYTPVRLLSIPAQRFIQFLFKDSQLHHRMLQLMVRRLRKANQRSQMRQEAPAVRIARVLVSLADTYGSATDTGVEICNLPDQDVADLSSVSEDESVKVMDKLREKGWIEVNEKEHTMTIVNTKQMQQLAGGR
ncbi:putative transcriptional regulator, Crp/Fnr family [Thalassoporum mexicanum PCC 7367]|uniref:Crp/Fnr family transcriptional regulator n=1 Tax=Thalassoporum mexicanum TaxID=3457544 RepID=UPI00029FCA0F|nr:Crp/Fnr family transcriptional regulator [Pseudanabaena sp. PCC 7367]AFY69937.1 putative transcriptional regulator, Crp/Fnr family [Pseudanabaena sp. PCC 7367]